jgi:hypothetical protein
VGKGRLFSMRCGEKNENYGLTDGELLNFCIERFNVDIPKKYLAHPEFYKDGTVFIEFSRGGDYTYRAALNRFKPEILNRSAIIYVQVEPAESRRRNDKRYQEKLKHSILAHKTPDEIMDKYYPYDDWRTLTEDKPRGELSLNGVRVPFVTMNNEPESTDAKVLEARYGKALDELWKMRSCA